MWSPPSPAGVLHPAALRFLNQESGKSGKWRGIRVPSCFPDFPISLGGELIYRLSRRKSFSGIRPVSRSSMNRSAQTRPAETAGSMIVSGSCRVNGGPARGARRPRRPFSARDRQARMPVLPWPVPRYRAPSAVPGRISHSHPVSSMCKRRLAIPDPPRYNRPMFVVDKSGTEERRACIRLNRI